MLLALVILYGIIGTVIGRILFVKRLKDSTRYTIERKSGYSERKELVETLDYTSAQTYGLWSIFLWPLTMAFFLVQMPTMEEKAVKLEYEIKDAQKRLERLAKDLLET